MKIIDEKISQIRKLIKISSNPIMFFDTDTDGTCSYLQLKKAFPQIKQGFAVSKDTDSQLYALEKIEEKHDLIIFFDMPYIATEFFEKIKNKKAIWVDHHQVVIEKHFDNNDNILFFNPLFYSHYDERCSSYWAYKIANTKENLFYVSMASVADFYILDILINLYNYNKNQFNLLFKISDKKRQELFNFIQNNSVEETITKPERKYWIEYLEFECEFIKFKYFFDLLYKIAKNEKYISILKKIEKLSPLDFKLEIENSKDNFFEKFHKTLKEYDKIFQKNYRKIQKQTNHDLIIIEHKNTKISFNRQLAEETAYKVKDFKVIISTYQKDSKEIVSMSLRGNNFNVNNLIQECMQGLDGRGGGHKDSSGCAISKKDYPIFIERIKKKFN